MPTTAPVMLRLTAPLLCAALTLAGCAKPFDYAAASAEEQQAWLDSTAEGMADGLNATLPRGTNGFHAEMGTTRVDAAAKTIDINVNITQGGDRISIGTVQRQQMVEQMCNVFRGTELEQNGVTVTMRYMLPGGGSALSITMSQPICESYRG